MKTLKEFLAYLCDLDIKLWLEDNALRYSAPEETITTELLTQLRERKAEILVFLKANPSWNTSTSELIQPLSRESHVFPLSFAQQRLWFLIQLEGQSATYNIPVALRLYGQLNENALQRALISLVERHDSLRCCFPVENGEATVQLNPVYNPLFVTDLTEFSKTEQKHLVTEWISKHAQTPFDLSTGPLLNMRLLKLSEQEPMLLCNMHHIISDGWSLGVLVREWSQLYSAYVLHEERKLPALPIQYTDYAAWQRNWLQGEVLEQQLAYWSDKLIGVPELLELPTDYPRPAVMRYQGKHVQSTLGKELTRGFKSLSQQHSVTVFMTLLAAFNVLLSRYSGQTDLVVGTPIANRTHHQTENLIGFFVNTLVLRTQIKGEQTFPELLKQVRQTALEAYSHQDIPFEYLVEQVNPSRSMSHSPLFQVMFVLHNAPEESLELSGLKMSFLEPENTTAQFDLTLSIAERGEVFVCDWEYNTDLFRLETIARMTEHFQILLEGIVNHSEESLSQLPLFTTAEQQQLLAWNQTETDYPKNQTIVDLFQMQVEKTPENIAVVFEEQALSYQVLNTKANQLAHDLMTLGVGTETLVGICVERSLEMVIGLLGILKAGGAYVPLDPDYPPERLQFMLEDSEVKVLLSQSHLLSLLPVSTAFVVCLDSEKEQIAGCSGENPLRQSGPENLAYVIYTSGSTGVPKGVMVGLAAITQHVNYSIIRYQIEPSDNVLQFASLNFDASIEQILSTWCGGARLVLLSTNLLPTEALQNIISKEQITIADLPPAYWQQLLHEINNPNLEQLKLLILGGDALSSQLAQQTRQFLSSDIILLNAYGPTEATITATLFEVTEQFQANNTEKVTPIGQPIANTQIYILDANHNPTPLGIPGELCIGGHGLARGYLNRPELTAEKFLEIEVFGKAQRLYKTGDLGRWLPDGNLEYLGRLDHQVKLRGFRIELGEIEARLTQHEAVKEGVVVLLNPEDNPRLVAYVTLSTSIIDVTNVLRHWLKAHLPEYMLPTSVTVLDQLPLTPNGKLDRKMLPEPDLVIQAEQLPPQTETEFLLCNLWSQVLRFEVISLNSHFFEVGGHSLLATQLVSRIRESFGIEMPLQIFFEFPRLQEQAQWLSNQQRQTELPPIIPLASDEPLVLSFAQQRLWFLEQLEGQSATYNIPAALRLTGPLDETALQHALTALIRHHDSLRCCFPVENGEATVQLNPVYNPLFVTDLTELSETEQAPLVTEWISKHAQTPFDLSTGPLLNFRLLKRGKPEPVLLCSMHHIISDGWSLGVLVREWSQLYSAYVLHEEPKLPALPIQYTDYAAWQRNGLQGEVLEQQLAYWSDKLAGVPELLELPTDYPRPAIMRYQGQHQQSTLDKNLTQGLKQLSQQQGVTLYMTLLAAFNVLLFRYSGQSDLVVGSPIANRTHHQTEDLIGFFVNTLVLRTQVQGKQSFNELLKQIRQTTLKAYTYQDIPFDSLVEQLNISRSLSYSPLFQVMFVLQNVSLEEFDLAGLKVSFLEQEISIAKFDLTLSISEASELLWCDWEYNTDLFRPETIARMTEHFQILLEGIVKHSEQSLSQLPLLTEAEQQQLLAWNQTETDYPKDQTIVDLFQAQVEKTPENLAVLFEEQSLTYWELNTKANQLAHYLTTLGAGTETLIGICVERSLEMIIGLLGILKAGAAYVPIDPSYPPDRIRYMLDDCAAPLLLVQSHLKAHLPLYELEPVCVVVCLDEADFAGQPTENLAVRHLAEDLAYVIYTSGSTGKPKGVMVEHCNLLNSTQARQDYYQSDTKTRLLLLPSFAFDAFGAGAFLMLSNGGSLYLPESPSDIDKLAAIIRNQKISHLICTPILYQELLEQMVKPFDTLLSIIFGGEVASQALLQQHFIKTAQAGLFNEYGPTEATIWSTIFRYQTHREASNIIGQPIANTRIYILDAQHQHQPLGIPGELCIAGAGLARGYLNCPESTAEKFIEIEIFGKTECLYKTGDLARWRADGNLEYLGRIDHQIKLRGFRIELGEIEATLTQHENVQEAVVLLYNKEDNPRLVAYVALAVPIDEVSGVLRTWLKTRLPEYMLPANFTVLDKLPLTPNGKIDRKALEQLSVNREQLSGENFVAPRTKEEELLAGIWSLVLGIDKIGIHDNFFDMGGHSLQAVQLISKIALATKIDISVKQLFLYPTIAQLATLLEKSDPKRNPIEPNHSTSQRENHPISKGELIVPHSSPYFQLERRSLLSLLSAKKILPVNAAALGYLPNAILERTELSREEIIEQWFDNLPVVSDIIETAWGRIAGVLLPRFNSELYGDTDDIVGVILDALEIAGQIGATTVSLTGIIPSATDYGRAIVKVMADDNHLPQITTGHSTTSATVVLAIQKILQRGGREMAKERVGIIGLGSIGFSSLCLLLKCLPHPLELILCDLYSKKEFLEEIRGQLVSELGFRGKIQLLFSEVELPAEIYNATLIVGATNVPDVLDIGKVKSGTLIVDDSGPHCFKTALAVKRFQEHQDILLTEGGVLKSPQPIHTVQYLPHHVEKSLKKSEESEESVKHNPFKITGCVFSSVLSSSFENLKPTVGVVQLNDSVKYYETLISLGFQAADLHCENYVLPDEAISHFRGRFGH